MMSTQTTQKQSNASSQTASVLLQSIQITNLLSFGPQNPQLLLKPLNILIGPNGTGKSNLIEVLCLLRASTTSLQDVLRRGGGVREWIWKGAANESACIDAVMVHPHRKHSLLHHIEFAAEEQSFKFIDERIENDHADPGHDVPIFYYKYQGGSPVVNINGHRRTLKRETIEADKSILAQRRDPEQYPEITFLGEEYNRIRAYREWGFGRNTVFREPQRADMRTDRLEEDFSNLGLFLNKLRRNPQAKNKILTHLRDIYEGVDDFDVSIEGGTVQVFFTEGDFIIPATRLSDGTLRYLCLLAILCDPTPPPLICIEEPELGLHPDLLPKIADLLVEASERTQLIVTTHSEILVDAMTETPENIIVCEKHKGQTQMTRLSAADLSVWLEKYRLGDLWISGQLGGTRW